ncbi:MAG: histidine kinase [Bacteroidales bacterium]|nr:histidine kinase [Bacteroidales bacterium]
MVYYALDSRAQMQKERGRANLASYQYLKLKQQLNPHFLFNSLNALDSLICENKNEQASLYTHKLASLYRYMLKSEDEKLVSLKEELDFVSLYVDLMKVRFPEGFQLNVDVPEHLESRNVIPCSIQLLVENAIKHNSINVANQLKINVIANSDSIEVSNNIIKKFTKPTSIGVGQKYIRQQYFDLSGKNIEIIATDDNYIVKLPLI